MSFKALQANSPRGWWEGRRAEAWATQSLNRFLYNMGAGRHLKTTKRIGRILRDRWDGD